MPQNELWIGFAHVRPELGHSPFGEGIKGGFTHVVGAAPSKARFVELAREALARQNLITIELDDVDTVARYREEDRISLDMESVIDEASETDEMCFDTFYTYDKESG